jgi:hypothetical protein
LFVKVLRTWSGKSRDDPANLAILEQKSEFAVTGATIIADDPQIASAMSRKALN